MNKVIKYQLNLRVVAVERLSAQHVLVRLTDPAAPLPQMMAGQFVEVRVCGAGAPLLRRPISINFLDREANELHLLVAVVGAGTKAIASLCPGDILDCVLPLGRGFGGVEPNIGEAIVGYSDEAKRADGLKHSAPLLIGGGVGVAPLLYYGAELRRIGVEPTFLLGARSRDGLLMKERFERYGRVFVTTEDGSEGDRGFVTDAAVLQSEKFTSISCCGPKPMMVAVARYARRAGIPCEVSLENVMACGLGACLCCVEKTKEGNVCVCKDGPVFDINRLTWQI